MRAIKVKHLPLTNQFYTLLRKNFATSVHILGIDFNSYNKTNEMHYFLKFIFGIKLYIFRTAILSIIRSLALYTQR